MGTQASATKNIAFSGEIYAKSNGFQSPGCDGTTLK